MYYLQFRYNRWTIRLHPVHSHGQFRSFRRMFRHRKLKGRWHLLLHWYFQGRSRNCYSAAWLKVRPVLLERFPRRIPSNKRRNRHSCFRYHIRFLEHSCKRQRLQAVHLLLENTNSQRSSLQTVRSDLRSMLQMDRFLHSMQWTNFPV